MNKNTKMATKAGAGSVVYGFFKILFAAIISIMLVKDLYYQFTPEKKFKVDKKIPGNQLSKFYDNEDPEVYKGVSEIFY